MQRPGREYHRRGARSRIDRRAQEASHHAGSGQVGVAHEVAVALAGSAAAFVERPDNQALATTAVTGGKDALEVRGILLELGFDISPWVALNSKLFEHRLFGPEKAHRQQNKLDRTHLFGARHFLGLELAF